MSTNDLTLTPYLHFPGNCEDALNTYQEILGGRFEIQNRYDNPNINAPKEYQDKVLHARFYNGKCLFMACDMFPGQTVKSSMAVALSLDFNDLKQAENVFSAFAKDGELHVPFEKQFWGDWHGNLTDQYGIRWMINHIED